MSRARRSKAALSSSSSSRSPCRAMNVRPWSYSTTLRSIMPSILKCMSAGYASIACNCSICRPTVPNSISSRSSGSRPNTIGVASSPGRRKPSTTRSAVCSPHTAPNFKSISPEHLTDDSSNSDDSDTVSWKFLGADGVSAGDFVEEGDTVCLQSCATGRNLCVGFGAGQYGLLGVYGVFTSTELVTPNSQWQAEIVDSSGVTGDTDGGGGNNNNGNNNNGNNNNGNNNNGNNNNGNNNNGNNTNGNNTNGNNNNGNNNNGNNNNNNNNNNKCSG